MTKTLEQLEKSKKQLQKNLKQYETRLEVWEITDDDTLKYLEEENLNVELEAKILKTKIQIEKRNAEINALKTTDDDVVRDWMKRTPHMPKLQVGGIRKTILKTEREGSKIIFHCITKKGKDFGLYEADLNDGVLRWTYSNGGSVFNRNVPHIVKCQCPLKVYIGGTQIKPETLK